MKVSLTGTATTAIDGSDTNGSTASLTDDDDFDLKTASNAGIDAGTATVLTFGPSDTDQSISITLVDDDLYEGGSSGTPETVTFTLGTYENARAGTHSTLVYSIVDDESAPELQIDTDNTETSGTETAEPTPTVTVKSNRRSIYDATVAYTTAAKSGTTTLTSGDYTLEDATATIAAGATSTTIPLAIIDDGRYEEDETMTCLLYTSPSPRD